jgi:hypothetical protein
MLGPSKIIGGVAEKQHRGPFETIGSVTHPQCWAHTRSSVVSVRSSAGPIHDYRQCVSGAMLGPFQTSISNLIAAVGPFETIGSVTHRQCWAPYKIIGSINEEQRWAHSRLSAACLRKAHFCVHWGCTCVASLDMDITLPLLKRVTEQCDCNVLALILPPEQCKAPPRQLRKQPSPLGASVSMFQTVRPPHPQLISLCCAALGWCKIE